MSRTSYVRPLALLLAVALAVSVLMVLWAALPVQAQSESTDNDTGDAPAPSESTDNATGAEPQPTGEHLIVFSDTDTLPPDYEQRIADLGGTVEDEYPEIGVVVASGLSEEAAESLEAFEDVEVVEEDVERQWLDPPVEEPLVEEVSAEGTSEGTSVEVEPASATAPNTASFYPRQWHLRAIGANSAWNASPKRLGSPEVTVAILDTGLAYTHPDLAGRVDLTRSTSFAGKGEDDIVKANFPGAHPIADLHYHGTHVGATVSSNATAAAGVTSGVTLMGVKVLDRNGNGPASNITNGIIYAADQGADVMNMSLSLNGKDKEGRPLIGVSKSLSPGFVSTINRAINYANRKGTAIVVSAGNDNYDMDSDSDRYLAFCQSTHVVCVSATGPTAQASVNGPWTNIDAKASYTNYGPPITVAAPGGNGASRVTAACSRFSMQQPICRTGVFVLGLNGTSQAAPHASGLAALLVEDIGKNQPSKVTAQLRKSAVDLGELDKDVIYGYGRINVAKALKLQQPSP